MSDVDQLKQELEKLKAENEALRQAARRPSTRPSR